MAKLVTMFMILIALQAVMVLYAEPVYASTTTLWDFVSNIDNWNSLSFILGFIGLAVGVGIAGIAVGAIFGVKTDLVIFAVAIPGLLSMGVIFVNFANMVRDELIAIISPSFPACTLLSCPAVNLILAATIGPIAFYYVWTVIEWWRGKDM